DLVLLESQPGLHRGSGGPARGEAEGLLEPHHPALLVRGRKPLVWCWVLDSWLVALGQPLLLLAHGSDQQAAPIQAAIHEECLPGVPIGVPLGLPGGSAPRAALDPSDLCARAGDQHRGLRGGCHEDLQRHLRRHASRSNPFESLSDPSMAKTIYSQEKG
ncbi:unnamed protein product, partial [Effrenium voratum]